MALTKATYGMISADTSTIDLNIDANTLYVDSSANRVGIGTNSPTSALHVIGTNDAAGGITLGGPTENNSAQKVGRIKTAHYSTSEEPFTAILTNAQTSSNLINIGGASGAENAATHIKFFTAANNTTLTGTQRMIIDSSGNVGIGLSNPSHILDVTGDKDTWISKIYNSGSDANAQGLLVRSDATGSHDAMVLGVYAHNAYRMVVKSTGNVGIGTTAPSSVLHISDASSPEIRLEDSDATSTFNITTFQNAAGNLNYNTRQNDGTFVSTDYQIIKNAAGANIHKWFIGNVEKVRLDASGRLGIGTNSPANKLHVSGGNFQIDTDANSTLTIADGGADAVTLLAASGDELYLGANNAYKLRIKTDGNVVMDNGGNFGIGTASPSQGLSIEAADTTVRFMETKNSAGSMLVGVNGSGDSFVSGQTSGKSLILETNNTERMRISSDGKVGIGTNNPTGQRLCIGGHSSNNNMNEANAWFVAENTGGDGLAMGSITSSPFTTWIQSGYLNTMATSNHYPLALNPHGGNVGIGENSPDAPLEIKGAPQMLLHLHRNASTPGIKFTNGGGTGYGYLVGDNDEFTFGYNDGSSSTGKVYINATGELGVGISPTEQIHTYVASGSNEIRNQVGSNNFYMRHGVNRNSPQGTNTFDFLALQNQDIVFGTSNAFLVGDGGVMNSAASNRMRVDGSGVTIGEVAPTTTTTQETYERRLWVDGQGVFHSQVQNSTTPRSTNSALNIGPSGTRGTTGNPGTAAYNEANPQGHLTGGIAFDHLMNYSSYANMGYNLKPHGWLGMELHSTPGHELSNMLMCTREGVGANDETKVAQRWYATGEITTPRNPAWHAYGTGLTNQTTQGNHGTWVEVFDRSGDYVAGTTNVFTAPVDGIYAFYAQCNFNNNSSTPYYWRAIKNNASVGIFYGDGNLTGTWIHIQAFITVVLDKSDTFEWYYRGDPDEGADWAQAGGFLIG